MNQEELKKYYNIFIESWQCFKKLYIGIATAKNNEEYDKTWFDAMEESSKIANETPRGNSELASKIVMAMLDEIEMIAKESRS